jgi:hypothetical protein
VIKIARTALPEPVAADLLTHTAAVTGVLADRRVQVARERWKGNYGFRTHLYPVLRATLEAMAPGIQRCMFCGDNEGMAVDHFEPVAIAPTRTFEWINHLLACAKCNSEFKQDRFPRAADGTALLIDPTSQDPADHLHLVLAVGEYQPLTPMGAETIRVLQLNRGPLVKGRRDVYRRTALCVAGWRIAVESGTSDEAELRELLWEQPLADVVDAMLRQAESPGAEDIFADDLQTLALLRDPQLRTILMQDAEAEVMGERTEAS